MTNKEILQKAIEKAEKNGYQCEPKVRWALFQGTHFACTKSAFFSRNQNYHVQNTDREGSQPGEVRRWHSIFSIIFSHEFAKAFWGEEVAIHSSTSKWEYHLSRIVLEKEPLRYLEKFLK